MPTTSRSLRTVAWSALAFSTARAYVIDNMSFGHKPDAYISPDLHNVPHWTYQGKDDFMPQILSDRIILTPPYPGSKRGSIWANDPFHHTGDWTTELDFRVSGMDRGGGNLQLWYVKESQARETPASLYTVGRFDGLVIVIDQYEGRGGSVRGFLNDGSVDMKSHANPDTLSFGKCDYAYRNRGILSSIKLHHTDTFIEVLVDGHTCFKTDKVKLPEGYYFGISASSAENPDSFEVHKFLTSSANKDTRENPIRGYGTPQDHQAQQNIAMQNAHEKETHKQTQHHSFGSPTDQTSIPKMLEDAVAGTIRSQQDQFADLHNRIQIINNRVAEMFELVERMADTNDQRFNAIMHRLVPVDDRGAATIKNVEKIERTTMSILRDLESKDFKDMMQQIHRALENNQEGLTRTLPVAMNAVYAGHKPSVTTFLFIAIAVQIMITGAYIVYKKRRTGAKKYL